MANDKWLRLICAGSLLASCIYGGITLKNDLLNLKQSYTSMGLLIYTIHAILLMLYVINSSNNGDAGQNVRKWENGMFFLSLALATGFLNISAYLKSGGELSSALFNLAPFVMELIDKSVKFENRKYTKPMVDIAHGINMGFMLYLATTDPIMYLAAIGAAVAQVFRDDDIRKYVCHIAQAVIVASFVEHLK